MREFGYYRLFLKFIICHLVEDRQLVFEEFASAIDIHSNKCALTNHFTPIFVQEGARNRNCFS